MAKRGRGRMSASHQVSGESHRCFPLGTEVGGGAADPAPARSWECEGGWRRFGVEMEPRMPKRVLGVGWRKAGGGCVWEGWGVALRFDGERRMGERGEDGAGGGV